PAPLRTVSLVEVLVPAGCQGRSSLAGSTVAPRFAMTHDLVSIVMPAYNVDTFIAEAIASVHAQTYRHWKLIVVDDCSSDGTVRVAREWTERYPRVSVLSSPVNGGTSSARNLGLS